MGIVLTALYKMRPKYSHFQGMNLHILNGSSSSLWGKNTGKKPALQTYQTL